MVRATVIADSISPDGVRLTTVEVKIHRFIHSELMTHRVFSRNSASSRAIPIEKQLARILSDLAMPVEFGSNQPGMQAGPPLAGKQLRRAEREWRKASKSAMKHAKKLLKLGVHKQVVNRILEPFMWHTVIITATDWDGFFDQRCHPDAQPEIRVAAECVRDAMEDSRPRLVGYGEWHLPYIQEDEYVLYDLSKLIKISVARCARVSYLTHDGKRDVGKDIELFDRLTTAAPPHWSPLEHVATPVTSGIVDLSNFRSWVQIRHSLDTLTYLQVNEAAR